MVKLGAVACILFLNPQFSIDLQLIGGVIILQTLPSVALGLYTRWLHRGGLIAGWVGRHGAGLWMVYEIANPDTVPEHFGGSAFPLSRARLRHQGRSTPGSWRCWSTWSSRPWSR